MEEYEHMRRADWEDEQKVMRTILSELILTFRAEEEFRIMEHGCSRTVTLPSRHNEQITCVCVCVRIKQIQELSGS